MVHSPRPSDIDVAAAHLPRFEIHAERTPQTLSRIIDLFARNGIVPADLRARTSGGGLWGCVHAAMGIAQAERLAEALRALVCVDAVILIPPAERPGDGGSSVPGRQYAEPLDA